ncbi:TPA: FUSC family protein [Morganella morganii subsp. morganii]|nr:FUSC family protein [Morganella morganii subsp. morganii]
MNNLLPKVSVSFFIAIWIITPWITGIIAEQPTFGSLMAFGAYLLIVSFPVLPRRYPLFYLLRGAGIISLFAVLGFSVTLGSVPFFVCSVVCAMLQSIAELRGSYLRLPVALGVLAYFLSVGQIPEQGIIFCSMAFTAGTFWSMLMAIILLPRSDKTWTIQPVDIHKKPVKRFTVIMVLTALIGSILATLMTASSHPCWLPAAGLRVMKPERSVTLARLQARGAGTIAGAAAGGVLLGCYTIPALHAGMVGVLLFLMLIIGAKRYGYWTFCLTAIALTFNLAPGVDSVYLAADRVLLTVIALAIVTLMLRFLPEKIN